MGINRSFGEDDLTGLPDFMRFFSEDFEDVFGDYGQLLLIKIGGLESIVKRYGCMRRDEIIKSVGMFLADEPNLRIYRQTESGFLVVFKENIEKNPEIIKNKLLAFAEKKIYSSFSAFIDICTRIIPYHQTIKSLAAYYELLYESFKVECGLEGERELLHQLLENLLGKVNKMIALSLEIRNYALWDEVSELQNSKAANIYLEGLDKKKDKYAVLFIDGDSLSSFNKISYNRGNQAIKEIARLTQESLRKEDKAFRWLKGDEFIVVAVDMSKENLKKLAERIRKRIEIHFKDQVIKATVSIGISSNVNDINTILSNIDEVVSEAERANKMAKKLGKNQVVFFEDMKNMEE